MTEDHLLTQIVIAYLATHLIEFIKGSASVPWVTKTTDRVNKAIGAFLAALTVVGIAVVTTWDASTGTFTLVVSGLSATSVLTFIWHWLEQFILQQSAYKLIVKPNASDK